MSRNYYYFAASLPLLSWQEELPFSLEEFQAESDRLLDPEDSVEVRRALGRDGSPAANGLLRAYQFFEHGLRNEAASRRAQALKRDPAQARRGEHAVDSEILMALDRAEKSGDLLAAQRVLDEARWDKVEELARGHFFDLDFIVAYALKLKLLARYDVIRSDRGQKKLDELQELAAGSARTHV